MTYEELIASGKILCRAYYLGNRYSEDNTNKKVNEVTSVTDHWVEQAQKLYDMGYSILGGGTPTVTGQTITGPALIRQAEQLAENVKVTLEAVEKQPELNKKLLAQWRFALNCFFGTAHKRGLIPNLKDAGPGAY